MNNQQLFNIVVLVCSGFGSWIIRTLFAQIKELQIANAKKDEQISNIQILIAGQYVRRDDLDKLINALFAKLDKIDEKLDTKVDKTKQ